MLPICVKSRNSSLIIKEDRSRSDIDALHLSQSIYQRSIII
jgi:hypothetical protein